MVESSGRTPGLFVSFRDVYADREPQSAAGYAHALAGEIAAGLAANGWPCASVAPWLDEDLGGVFSGRLPPFVLNFNLLPKDVVANVRRDGGQEQVHVYRLLSEYLRVPVICVLLDHAAHHLPNIVANAYAVRNVRFAFFEKSAAPFLIGLGIPRERAIHMRWGGPPPERNPRPIAARRRAIVFHGSLRPLKPEPDFHRAAASLSVPAVLAESALGAVERIVEGEGDIYDSLLAEIRRRGIDPATVRLGVLSFLLQDLDLRSRQIRRERFLSAFAGLPVDFFGEFPDSFARKFGRATFHGVKPYGAIAEITRDAKMTLCENLNWRENIHPRITQAMALGSVVLAESNDTLRESFADMKNIALVSHPYRDAAEKAEAVLANPALAQAMADGARSVYGARHTWREAVKALAPLLPPPATRPSRRQRR
ncbi:MAG: glycosyltransferase family 1 protein [Rhodospirillales bacterium]|nr:glycosyltransferase family 1 protein [Rhodospirillales bacterium]